MSSMDIHSYTQIRVTCHTRGVDLDQECIQPSTRLEFQSNDYLSSRPTWSVKASPEAQSGLGREGAGRR